MRITVTSPDLKDIRQQGKALDRAQGTAMHVAVHKATLLGQKLIQRRIKGVGLGRLAGAIGATSSEKKRRRGKEDAWGAIFARGGDQSRAGQALEAYTQGATIRGRNVQWLAIATRALPARMPGPSGRQTRTTPKIYEANGSPLGPLVFKRLSANRAILIAQGDVTVSVKTGRAKRATGKRTRSRVAKRDVVAFVLIKETKRMKRFDQVELVGQAARRVPRYLEEEIKHALPGAVEKV